MRIQKQVLTKRISKDGRLVIDSPELQEFARQHPNRSCIVRVELLPIPPSQKVFSYYWQYICPTIQRALYETGGTYTLEQTDRWIREQAPVMRDEHWDGEKVRTRVKEFDEIDSAEMNEFIEWLKEFAAENLDCYIEEPQHI